MPFGILVLLLDLALVIHVVKTGRNMYWIFIIVGLPPIGPLAYVIVELLPELMASRTARRTVVGVKNSVDPSRDLRTAERNLRLTDSIDSRRKYAEELLANGRYAEAIDHFKSAMVGLYEHDPLLYLGLARAQFEKGDAAGARQSLDELIVHNPQFKSAEGHLLYARALEQEGNLDKALKEYETVASYFPGAEAKYRYAMLLKQTGKAQLARGLLEQLLNDAELASGHYRKMQKEWLSLAKRALAEF